MHLRARDWAIIGLTVATALLHISLLFPDPMFIANGLAYLGLLGALYLPFVPFAPLRRWARVGLIVLTAVTIIGWLAIGLRNPLGYATKVIEVALLVLLFTSSKYGRPG